MRKLLLTTAIAALAFAPAPAAAAEDFTLVNGTGMAMRELSIRRFGTQEWRPLGVAAPAAGARVPVGFSNPDCAFDIRAQLASGTTAIWSGVNLCEVSVVRLNREPSGELWVDYD